jgi:hypothetical protein
VLNYETVAKKDRSRGSGREGEDERNAKLDVLDGKLSSDRDPRDQEALRNLRGLYDSFMEDVRKLGKVSVAAGGAMFSQIEEIFARCVAQLEKQHEVWLTSRKVAGDVRSRSHETEERHTGRGRTERRQAEPT